MATKALEIANLQRLANTSFGRLQFSTKQRRSHENKVLGRMRLRLIG